MTAHGADHRRALAVLARSGAGQWYEAHNSFGVTATGTSGDSPKAAWAVRHVQTYILLANPDPQRSAFVTLSILMENTEPVLKMFVVPPSSRFNVDVSTTMQARRLSRAYSA